MVRVCKPVFVNHAIQEFNDVVDAFPYPAPNTGRSYHDSWADCRPNKFRVEMSVFPSSTFSNPLPLLRTTAWGWVEFMDKFEQNKDGGLLTIGV